jgi:UDP-glucose 4-epimerase
VNAYGPGQRVAPPFGPGKVKKIMPAFSCRALTGQPLEVYGSGQQISDMIYVEDVAKVFATTLEHLENSPVPKYSIEAGPSASLTVRQVAEQVIKNASLLTSFTSEIIDLPMRPGEKRDNDVPQHLLDQISAVLGNDSDSQIIRRNLRELSTRVTADITTLEQIGINASSFTPFDSGCALTVEWYFNNKCVTWNDNRN